MKPFWACKGPESKTFSPMNISFDSRCNDIAEIPHEDTVEASNVNDAEMSSSDDADMPNSETPNRNDAAASNDVTAEMPMSNDTTIHIDSSAEVPNSDAEVPSNVQAPSVEKPNPRCLTLAASKTFLEEDEEDEEEPVVEVNISTSGDAIICGDALTAVVETRQPSRWNALRKSRPSRQQWARKLPTTLPAWSRDIPKSLNGWTRREKILLFIAILNTLIIVALLGSNMAILKQKTRTQTQLSAMSKSESSIECGNGPIAGGESGGKGSGGKKKKDSEGEGTANEGGNPETDPVVADDEVEADDDGSNSGDMWTVSTNTSLAGGQPAQNNSNSTSNNSNGTGTNTNGGNSDAPIDNGNGGVDNSDGSTAPPNDTGDDTGDGGEAEPLGDPDSLCGCPSCTESIWNQVAEQATCGDRITFLQEDQPLRFPTEVHACRQIAFEFPCICGGCDPGRCNIPTNEFLLPDSWKPSTTDKFAQIITPAPTPVTATTAASIVQENQVLYCYPDPSARISYTLWGGMVVQVKEDLNVCGPGNNMFSNENVVVDEQADTLTLVYTEGQAAEVRILLPQESRPFSYGSYSFSVQSVEVKDVTGAIKSTILPKELILGLFTWDDTGLFFILHFIVFAIFVSFLPRALTGICLLSTFVCRKLRRA